jgi:hypothetical protein
MIQYSHESGVGPCLPGKIGLADARIRSWLAALPSLPDSPGHSVQVGSVFRVHDEVMDEEDR